MEKMTMKTALKHVAISIAATVFLTIAAPQSAHAVEVERVVSDSGIEAWLIRDLSNPITTLKLSFRGGAALDPDGKEGLAHFVASTLDEGSGDMESNAFQKALDDRSITLRFNAGRDSFRGTLRTLNQHRDDAFKYLRLALTSPRFDDMPLTRIRAQIISGIKQSEEDPSHLANQEMFEMAFAGHPYARPTLGTVNSLMSVTPDDMRQFVATRLVRDNLIIGVVGDIDPATLKTYLDATFAELPNSTTSWALAKTTPQLTGAVKVIDLDVGQSSIQFGQPGIARSSPDFYTAYVLNYILGGGGFVSRLYEEVREKRGLAYSVYTYLMPLDASAAVMGGAGTANERVAETLDTVRNVWEKFAEDGPTQDELNDAKTYLTGAYPLRFASSSAISDMLVGIQEEGMGIDYIDNRNGFIDAVTLSDAKRVAASLFQPKNLSFVIAGRPQGVVATD